MGISSPSLLPISISLSLSHFLFCFITGEGRSCRAPPLAKGDHVKLHRHREVPDPRSSEISSGSGEISPDLASSSRIW
uniref:Secreted protein n=1 Tax=Fagus sylvatica TaxID=28930 RepID=A0A2N9GFA8_FAGSY